MEEIAAIGSRRQTYIGKQKEIAAIKLN